MAIPFRQPNRLLFALAITVCSFGFVVYAEPPSDFNGDGHGDVVSGTASYSHGQPSEGTAYTYLASSLASTGDYDADGAFELDDYAACASCMAGPGFGVDIRCTWADRDGDGDVDLGDFARFVRPIDWLHE